MIDGASTCPASSPASRCRSGARRAAPAPPSAGRARRPPAAAFAELGLTHGRRPTVAIQGFGKVGGRSPPSPVPEPACGVVAVSDVARRVHNPGGLDVPPLADHVAAAGTVAGYAGGDAVDPRRPARPSTATCSSPPRSQAPSTRAQRRAGPGARIVVEAANGPTTPEADACSTSAGVHVVPDILANAGGVTVVLLRVGAEPAVPAVDRGPGRGAAVRHHADRVRTGHRPRRRPRPDLATGRARPRRRSGCRRPLPARAVPVSALDAVTDRAHTVNEPVLHFAARQPRA